MSRKNANRWRCLITGCNPLLFGEDAATDHRDATGHRVAKWPVRSAEGKRRARLRNKTGYYDKYNVGHKSYAARFGGYGSYDHPDEFTLSPADMAMDEAGPFGDD